MGQPVLIATCLLLSYQRWGESRLLNPHNSSNSKQHNIRLPKTPKPVPAFAPHPLLLKQRVFSALTAPRRSGCRAHVGTVHSTPRDLSFPRIAADPACLMPLSQQQVSGLCRVVLQWLSNPSYFHRHGHDGGINLSCSALAEPDLTFSSAAS